jgi:hypothetical protein
MPFTYPKTIANYIVSGCIGMVEPQRTQRTQRETREMNNSDEEWI